MADRTGLPFDDTADFEAAERGLIDAGDPVVRNDKGDVVWDNGSYTGFLTGDAPDTVHPSLWRQSSLVAKQGLFEVTDGIYQVRGYDLSNVSIIEGDTGVIVIDPLISAETAAAALALYRKHRGDRPVVAVIYTHSHVDHFGGVKGVVSQDDVDAGRVQIIAPDGFVEHAISENVYAGTAMARRSAYMFGAALSRSPQGGLGAGLGQTNSTGTITLIDPTVTITTTGHELTVDGADIVAHLSPEMLFDALAIQVDGPKAWDLDLAIRWDLPDHGASYRTTLHNGVLTYIKDSDKPVGLTLTVPAAALTALAGGDIEAARSGGLTTDGDQGQLASLFSVLQPGDPNFNIIQP
jgi:alkyl sulfatase BDS1-like metallo-beta-lactamase superfamily hydrolase